MNVRVLIGYPNTFCVFTMKVSAVVIHDVYITHRYIHTDTYICQCLLVVEILSFFLSLTRPPYNCDTPVSIVITQNRNATTTVEYAPLCF